MSRCLALLNVVSPYNKMPYWLLFDLVSLMFLLVIGAGEVA